MDKRRYVITCPYCRHKIPQPTSRQMQAYYYVHQIGFTQEQTAQIMGVGRTAIENLLTRQKKKFPHFFASTIPYSGPKKRFRYYERRDYKPKMKF